MKPEYSGDGSSGIRAGLSVPYGVALDSAGNIFVSESEDHRVRRIDSSGVITTVAGTGSAGFSGDGGLATSARLVSPFGLAVDADGNLYIADSENARIRRVDREGVITTGMRGGG